MSKENDVKIGEELAAYSLIRTLFDERDRTEFVFFVSQTICSYSKRRGFDLDTIKRDVCESVDFLRRLSREEERYED